MHWLNRLADSLPLQTLIERLLTTADPDWADLSPAQMSAFGSVEYARIYEQATGYSARLFVLAAEEARLTYPFFIRPLRGLPFTAAAKAEWGDLLSPEYTGPVVQQPGIAPEEFRARFRACCLREKWIAEFAHLHPWQSCAACLDPCSTDNSA